MSMIVPSAFSVHILSPGRESQDTFQGSDIPARSRLYRLEPQAMGSLWQESLTSYLNRLGWTHHVSPRAMVTQEVIPHLDKTQEMSRQWIGALSRGNAMNMNGAGLLALEWSKALERLTMRSDLHLLTLHCWIGNLSAPGHLKACPAWCPMCYTQWQEEGQRIYQPLLWFFKTVTVCPKHNRSLESHCSHCQKKQSVIALQTSPGHCTQCNRWLGVPLDEVQSDQTQEDQTHWQQWMFQAMEELRIASTTGLLQWEMFFTHLARGMTYAAVTWEQIERFTGIKTHVLHSWLDLRKTPSLETILKLCYVCEVTPFQVMRGETSSLIEVFQRGVTSRPPLHRRVRRKIDQARCLQLIHAVLDGQEEPLGLRQLCERLGCSRHTLLYYFREECALITQQAREHRKQQSELHATQTRERVREQVLSLHAQGIYPSHQKLRAILPAGLMRQPAADEAWRATLRELGFEL